jgi:hypothetical protein
MKKSANRRQFLQEVTALSAAGGVSVALGNGARGQQVAQVQANTPTANTTRTCRVSI